MGRNRGMEHLHHFQDMSHLHHQLRSYLPEGFDESKLTHETYVPLTSFEYNPHLDQIWQYFPIFRDAAQCRKKYWRCVRRPKTSRRPEGEAPHYASRWESSLLRWPWDGLVMASRGYQDDDKRVINPSR